MRTCLITGATSGIGRATAMELGRLGWDLWLVGRNRPRGEAVARAIERLGTGARAQFVPIDVSNLSEVRALATQLAQGSAPLDALINNAGARILQSGRSVDGIELTFATNHLGHFLLTLLLLKALGRSSSPRILNVASSAHHSGRGQFPIQPEVAAYDGRQAYAESKLANVLFTRELSRRLARSSRREEAHPASSEWVQNLPVSPVAHGLFSSRGHEALSEPGTADQSLLTSAATSITVNAVDPGGVATRFARNNGWGAWLRHCVYYLKQGALLNPRRACQTIVWLATDESVAGVSGGYFANQRPAAPSKAAQNPELATQLWDLSIKLARIAPGEIPSGLTGGR